jgi:predicted metal-dependent hydrolase
LGWIRKQRKAFQQQPRETARTFVSGESHYLWGNRYLLEVKETTGKHRIERKGSKYLVMFIQSGTTPQNRARLMKEWYREQLKAEIPGLLQKWEPLVGVQARDWGVKHMHTKWGTCNPDAGRIWLNLELSKKPKSCLEYIVVHELVHLLERSHSDRFIAHLDRVMPKWRVYREELNKLPISHEHWDY